MLPKILRIRRCFVVDAVVLRGASIALVAMCFPALCEAQVLAPRSAVYPGDGRDPILAPAFADAR